MSQMLAKHYRVIAFDWYGHGSSAASEEYNKECFLEQMDEVIEHLVPDRRFDLYCFSMGNFLGCHYLRAHPECEVQRLVMHSPWNAEASIFSSVLPTVLGLPGIGRAGCALARWAFFPYCKDAATLQKLILTLGEGTERWTELVQDIAGAQLPQEVLLICGEGETPFYKIATDVYECLGSKAQLFSFPRAQHMDWCDHWDKEVGSFFREHVEDFLTRSLEANS